jgi:hypothetical protein
MLPDTEVMQKIWSKPHWRIWICPTEFKRARFQNLEQCREFMMSSSVRIQGSSSYPWVTADRLEVGHECVAWEIDICSEEVNHTERWLLFRSGQFVQNRTLPDIPQLAGGIHALEILEATTAVYELAWRMARRGALAPLAVITFELRSVDGRALTWPKDIVGGSNAVGPNCWAQDEAINTGTLVTLDELETRRRDLALKAALEIYSKFAWSDPPMPRLTDEQRRRFGSVRQNTSA